MWPLVLVPSRQLHRMPLSVPCQAQLFQQLRCGFPWLLSGLLGSNPVWPMLWLRPLLLVLLLLLQQRLLRHCWVLPKLSWWRMLRWGRQCFGASRHQPCAAVSQLLQQVSARYEACLCHWQHCKAHLAVCTQIHRAR